MSKWFAGKRTLLTGASSGIGLELARQLIGFGADLKATGRRPGSELPEDWSGAPYRAFDLVEPDAPIRVKAWLDSGDWDELDLLILNAGSGHYRPLEQEDASSISGELAVNLTGPIALTWALADKILAARGHVVVVGSTAHKGASDFPIYAASKGALDAFVRSLRSEWRGRAMVQILHPGPTKTAMHERAGYDPGLLRHVFMPARDVASTMLRQIAAGRSPVSIGYLAVMRNAERQFLRGRR